MTLCVLIQYLSSVEQIANRDVVQRLNRCCNLTVDLKQNSPNGFLQLFGFKNALAC